MAAIQYYDHNFPYFPLPPPPPKVSPPHNFPSPPKVSPPHNSPSPPKVSPSHNFPSPPKASPPHIFPSPPKVSPPHNSPPPPKVAPSPTPAAPPHSFRPPPPAAKPPAHSIPPPSPFLSPPPPHIVPSPPPQPGHHSTIIVVVFVSLGGLFFLAFLSVALCYFIKKKNKKIVQKTEIVHIDEHVKVQEAIIPGPHGEQNVVLTIEEDVHIEKEIEKIEKVSEGSHIKSEQDNHQALDTVASTSESSHHHLKHKA